MKFEIKMEQKNFVSKRKALNVLRKLGSEIRRLSRNNSFYYRGENIKHLYVETFANVNLMNLSYIAEEENWEILDDKAKRCFSNKVRNFFGLKMKPRKLSGTEMYNDIRKWKRFVERYVEVY